MSHATDSIHVHATAQSRIASPLGPLLLARTAEGLAGVWFEDQKHHPGRLDAPQVDDDALLVRTAAQLQAYFDGASESFDLPLDLQGSAFQRAVWAALLAIESGATRSYADIARAIGAPRAVRAVGAAVGRNPLSIVVPCHRVLGAGGRAGGFSAPGGTRTKLALLELEGAPLGGGTPGLFDR